MIEKKKIALPIIVEGRYDKNTIMQIFDATVITTGGFSLFNSKEKQKLIRKLAERGGVIVLTDSDGGGRQIRSFLSSILPREKIFHLYIPEIKGKERRKSSPSKAGLLGVEGMEREVLIKTLSPFIDTVERDAFSEKRPVTKLDLFEDGMSGGDGASLLRDKLCLMLDLPHGMSANALLAAINLLYSFEEYKACVEKIRDSLQN